MELREVLEKFLLLDHAASTRTTYREVLTPFVMDIGPGRPLALIRCEDVNAYMLKLRDRSRKWDTHPTRPAVAEPLATATLYKHSKTIRRFFNWCVEAGHLTSSPARELSSRRPAQALGEGKAATVEEVTAILHEVRKKPRDRAVILLLAESGARASEVAGLRIPNLVLAENRAWLDGKGEKRREIFFLDDATEAIRKWLAIRPDADHHYVFTSTRGRGKLNPQGISQITRRACRAAELDRILGAHAFRHYVGTEMARQHVPLGIIQAWLGHSDPSITLQYQRSLSREDIRAAGAALAR